MQMSDNGARATGLWEEIKRRKVVRVILAYILVGWGLIQVADATLEPLHLPEWSDTMVIWLVALGFPIAVILAWTLDITSGGIQVTPAVGEDTRLQAVPAKSSIAVLPFVNMSDDPANEYFSDGVTEEILNLLARIPELVVVSRASAFAYKGKDIHLPEVAAKLNVAHILEGSVRKAGNRVRITTQLIDARSDTHRWSETFDRTLDDIFAVQDEIAIAVSSALQLTLIAGTPTAMVTASQAHDLYLQGVHFFNRRTEAGFQKGIEYFRKALEQDPAYEPAWLMLGKTHAIMADSGYMPWKEGYAEARSACGKALSLAPTSFAAHMLRGWIAWAFDHDHKTAATHIRIAVELQPNDVSTMNNAACFAFVIGHEQQAIDLAKRAVRLQPADAIPHSNLAQWYAALGQFEESNACCIKALELNPDINNTHSQLAINCLLQGNPAKALELVKDLKSTIERDRIAAAALYELGDITASDRILEACVERNADLHPYEIAMIYAWRAENDQSFKWLDRAIEEGQQVIELKREPFFRGLHGDPRWEMTLARVGLTDAQLENLAFTLPELT